MAKFAPFDAADYLDDEETIAEYITAALEDPNPDVFLTAVRDVARARGMTQLAKDTGLGRESLYKALRPAPSRATTRCSSCFMLWALSSPLPRFICEQLAVSNRGGLRNAPPNAGVTAR